MLLFNFYNAIYILGCYDQQTVELNLSLGLEITQGAEILEHMRVGKHMTVL